MIKDRMRAKVLRHVTGATERQVSYWTARGYIGDRGAKEGYDILDLAIVLYLLNGRRIGLSIQFLRRELLVVRLAMPAEEGTLPCVLSWDAQSKRILSARSAVSCLEESGTVRLPVLFSCLEARALWERAMEGRA